jgi:predicted anti-sigma-YlaC factor YlaD
MTHPTDGALMALVDRAVGLEDGAQLEAHVNGCEQCRGVVTWLAEKNLLVGGLLEELDSPAPARSVASIIRRAGRQRRWRWQLFAAAASLLVVAIGSATMRPDLWRDVIRWVRPSAPPATGRARPAARPTVETPTVVAVESAGQVAIDFAALQSAGEILVTLGSDTRVTVSASGPVPYTVSQGAIALDNAGSHASYRIALPAAAERVTIRVGGRPVFEKRRATIVTNASRDSAGRYRIALDRGEPGP